MSVKLVSWNVNGIRAASKKPEFWDWFNSTNADIINFQEVRATEDSIPEKLTDVAGFNSYFNEAERKDTAVSALFLKSNLKMLLGVWELKHWTGKVVYSDLNIVISLFSIFISQIVE